MRSTTYTAAVLLAFSSVALAGHNHAAAHARLHNKRVPNPSPQVVQETPDGKVGVPVDNNWQASYAAKLNSGQTEAWQAEFAKTYGQPAATTTTGQKPATTAVPTLNKVPASQKAAKKKQQPKKKQPKPKKQPPVYGQPAAPSYGQGTTSSNTPQVTDPPTYGGGKGVKSGNAPEGGNDAVTVHIENRMGRPLSMLYVSNSGAPPAIGNPTPSATLGTSEPTGITFPRNWAGQITLGDDYQACGSKLEGSNTPPQIGFIDVSYVDGYSVPIVCSCGDKPDEPVSGCNVELDIEKNCPAENKVGKACTNPALPNEWGPTPPFFKQCEAAAYTFSKDDAATCGCPNSKVFNCCVGTACPSRSKATLKGGACQGSLKKRNPFE